MSDPVKEEEKEDEDEIIPEKSRLDQLFDGDHTMTLVDHLDELRARLIRSLFYIAAGFGIACFVTKDVLRFLERPAGDIKFQALSVEEPIVVFCKVAFYIGIVISSPFILYEVCRFVAPGLTNKEKQIIAPALVGGPILFVCGVAFAYYFLLPPMMHFFTSFSAGVTVINQRLDFYISLVSSILLYMGLCFQLPIVLFALSFTGLVDSDKLIKYWRYAVFGASVVALVITPDPTAFSMFMVMGALIGLYSITVVLLKIFGR